jgi:2-oxoacid dehydrogenase/acyltransferase catalytic subunit
VEGHITIREYLSLTMSSNHELIDGAPAARFTQRLKDLIESVYGLMEQETSAGLNEDRSQPQEAFFKMYLISCLNWRAIAPAKQLEALAKPRR